MGEGDRRRPGEGNGCDPTPVHASNSLSRRFRSVSSDPSLPIRREIISAEDDCVLRAGGKWLELFEEVHVQESLADVITYNATITACEKGKQWHRALELFETVCSQWLARPGGS